MPSAFISPEKITEVENLVSSSSGPNSTAIEHVAGGFSSSPLSLKHFGQHLSMCLKMPRLWQSEVRVGCLAKRADSSRATILCFNFHHSSKGQFKEPQEDKSRSLI